MSKKTECDPKTLPERIRLTLCSNCPQYWLDPPYKDSVLGGGTTQACPRCKQSIDVSTSRVEITQSEASQGWIAALLRRRDEVRTKLDSTLPGLETRVSEERRECERLRATVEAYEKAMRLLGGSERKYEGYAFLPPWMR